MKETTLTLDVLEAQMERLTTEQSKTYLGGNAGGGGSGGTQTPDQGEGPVTTYLSILFGLPVTSSQDAAGNWMISIGGGAAFPLTFQLNEVQITATGKVTDQSGGVVEDQFRDWIPDGYGYGYGGTGSGGGGGGGNGSSVFQPVDINGFYPPELVSKGNQSTALDIIGLMATALGTAASHLDIAASALNLDSQLITGAVMQEFGVFDIASNVIEFIHEPNWEDGEQIVFGIGLTFGELTPVGAVIGGAALAGWELYEYKRAH